MADSPIPVRLTAARLSEAHKALETALGASKVFFTELDRTSYQDKFAVDDSRHHPAGAISPETVEEVQAAIRVANQYKLPVWPISRGKNLGYGGSAPLLAGSVVMDLSRMKKIEFDERTGVVTLEPGVGFYDLYDYIQAHSLPYWLSTPGSSSTEPNSSSNSIFFIPLRSMTTLPESSGADPP